MTYLHGLRARILVLLLIGVVPVFALAAAWSVERDLALGRFQFYATAVSISAANERLGRVIERAKTFEIELVAAAVEGCDAVAHRVTPPTGFDSGFLITADGLICGFGTSVGGQPEGATVTGLRAALAQGGEIAFANDGNPGGWMVIGLRPANDSPALLILGLSGAETDRIFNSEETPFVQALAVTIATQPIVERHRSNVPAVWWPAGRLPPDAGPPPGLYTLPRQDGDSMNYFVAPLDPLGRFLIIGLQTQPFLGTDLWRLWTTIGLLAAILLATIAGALWAIDRSVLRWINYLRRIAIAHSHGHHSVRAKRLATAPKEIIDLGESLNLMANDAGRRVDLLREAAADKTALLLELHHRVKNNFQVITSLLSLLRQDMAAPCSKEIRFIEDFVRTMAVAYRVAYDSGDVTRVIVQDLLHGIIEALRDLAGMPKESITLQIEDGPVWIDLDKAISFGLYLAVTLPPYFDAVANGSMNCLTLSAFQEGACLRVAIGGIVPTNTEHPPLRRRLRNAYLRQLKAALDPAAGVHEAIIRIPLDNGCGKRSLATASTLAALARRETADPLGIADGCNQAAAGAGIVLASQGLDLRYRWACGSGLFDQSIDAVVGRMDGELLAPDAATALTQIKLQVLTDGEARQTVLHLAAPERWFSVHVQPMRDISGGINGVLTACHDITTYKTAENRNTLLMREMAHRSRNILAVTEAMARQSMAYSKSLDDFSERFSTRLHSLAMSHDLLTRRDWEGAHLRDLIRSQLGHYLLGDPPQISIEGPDVFLAATAIPYLGLALHELSTNAAKHGALSVAQGRVTVCWGPRWDAGGEEHIWLNWTEFGGPPVAPPTRPGFGMDVVKRIVSRALRGEVTLNFAPGGVFWRLDVLKANLDGQHR